MHQAVARDGTSVPAFERGDVFGAEFHLHLIELVPLDSVLADGIDHRVVRRERLLGVVFRLVEHARDQQRRPVVVE